MQSPGLNTNRRTSGRYASEEVEREADKYAHAAPSKCNAVNV